MKAYFDLVQNKESKIGCDFLKHQKWSGVEYMDEIVGMAQRGGTGTNSNGKDSTEHSKSAIGTNNFQLT